MEFLHLRGMLVFVRRFMCRCARGRFSRLICRFPDSRPKTLPKFELDPAYKLDAGREVLQPKFKTMHLCKKIAYCYVRRRPAADGISKGFRTTISYRGAERSYIALPARRIGGIAGSNDVIHVRFQNSPTQG